VTVHTFALSTARSKTRREPPGDHAGYRTYPVPDVKNVICETARVRRETL
jgi:hypothetical protein